MQKNVYFIPLAIIIAGALIGGGLALGISKYGSGNIRSEGANTNISQIQLRSVSENDHIRGNVSADLTLVEYSDLECPFCKRFHITMQQVMKEYGDKVRWVYRHFPLTQLHSKAFSEAEASECAAGQGKFWEYVDRLFEVTPSNNGLDPSELPKIAQFVGIDEKKFTDCLEKGTYKKKIEEDLQDAVGAGGRGTPYSILINAKGEKVPLEGALPYENIKGLIKSQL